jgi:hypothetical protein
MVQDGSPSQSWKTFFRNHAQAIAAIDLCVVPTLTFERLFAFLVLGHGRRQLLWFEVTRHPTAEWLARPVFHNNAAEVFGLGCQRRRSAPRQNLTPPWPCARLVSRNVPMGLGVVS